MSEIKTAPGMALNSLPDNWYVYVVTEGVDEDKPGIYEWIIQDSGSYIGKYKRIRRPTKEYGRNVLRLMKGAPYRRGKPDSFRRIHHELHAAVQDGRRIELHIIENVEPAKINARELELIALRGALNGPYVEPAIIAPID